MINGTMNGAKNGTKYGIFYGVTLAAVAGIGAYLLWRNVSERNSTYTRVGGKVSAKVAEKLPLAKDLPTIPDVEGNYDIDGVSYDSEGVVVSSDQSKLKPTTTH